MKRNMKKMTDNDQEYGNILGINVISTSVDKVLARIKRNLTHNIHFYIVTPNPELVLMAQKNKELRLALNESEFPVPDGVGLAYASRFLNGKPLNIIPGRKLFLELIKLADKNDWRVFLLGGESGEAELAAEKIKAKYKKIKIEAAQGPKLNKNAEPVREIDKNIQKDTIEEINKFIPDLLFVAFGNPKQEIWIRNNLMRLRIGGAMAVGGTFRYISGLTALPPSWLSRIGFEWLWRVFTEPKRIKRIINATIIFPWTVFRFKTSNKKA
jgi:N-acetylglucosaminyldiphosphoundecaprenol N-acetyl-beta-D-mannosaminyltransferase